MSTAQLPADFDPPEAQRSWMRHSTTGDLGYMVRRGGQPMVRLDRPMQEILRKPTSDWVAEEAHRPLSRAHSARVAFEADKALCAALGDHSRARKSWPDLTDAERAVWSAKGPPGALRSSLYRSIVDSLAPHVRT